MTTQQGPGQDGGSRRYQMLDVWRGAICLLVVLEHVGVVLWAGADAGSGVEGLVHRTLVGALRLNLGAPLFFVISGYCIASSVESARRKGQAPAVFLLRRLWRIFPTYWAALLGFVVVVLGLDAFGLTRLHQSDLALEVQSPGLLGLGQWLGNVTLTETWRPMVGGGPSSVYTRIAWSICYQEQFYIVCFLALALAPGRLFRFLAGATAVIVGLRVFAWDAGMLQRIEGTFLVYWHEFAVGLAVYWRLNRGADAPAAVKHALNAALAALGIVGLSGGEVSTAAAASFGLVLIGLHHWDAVAGRMAVLEPLRVCGKRSYSIYLVHVPVAMIGNVMLFDLGLSSFWARALVLVPVVAAASVAAGWAFHHAVERRFMGPPPLAMLAAAGAIRPAVVGPVAVGSA